MSITVAITAPGNMGAAVAARLVAAGAKVIAPLQGRSAASVARAEAAGMRAASDDEIAEADFILSILPPNEAMAIAARLAPAMKAATRKPIFVELNAISPETVLEISRVVEAAAVHFLDGSIIGMPPKAEGAMPTFFVSGPNADIALALNQVGMKVKALPGPIGAASALKMSFGGITKGLVALGAVMGLAADRYEVGDALAAELAASQPHLHAWFVKMVPDMFPKAYRWVPEMEEISSFLGDRPEADMFAAIARIYTEFANDQNGEQEKATALRALFAAGN